MGLETNASQSQGLYRHVLSVVLFVLLGTAAVTGQRQTDVPPLTSAEQYLVKDMLCPPSSKTSTSCRWTNARSLSARTGATTCRTRMRSRAISSPDPSVGQTFPAEDPAEQCRVLLGDCDGRHN